MGIRGPKTSEIIYPYNIYSLSEILSIFTPENGDILAVCVTR